MMGFPEEANRIPTREEMENLFVNNEHLEKIETYLNRFNPIRVMKMERMEIRHSAILAWLLDPKETHGLGDQFLKAFLGEAMRGCSELGFPTALDVSQSNMRDAEVRTEWQKIDIFVLSPANQWAFVIENKFDSRQHEGQLSKYVDKVKSVFDEGDDGLIVRGIFLTLHEEDPQDERYAPIRYDAICELLSRLIAQEARNLAPEVFAFLGHYLKIMEDATGMNEEREAMEKLARQLYRDHKKVLDYVIEHGASSDFAVAAHSLFGDDLVFLEEVEIGTEKYHFGGMGNAYISFLPASWFEALGGRQYRWPGCEGWWAGYPLIAWLQIWKADEGAQGQMWLYAEVGPLSDYTFRKALIESIQSTATEVKSKRIRFQAGATNEGRKYSKFLKGNVIDVKDIQDADEMASSMRKLLSRFQPEFQAVSEILRQYRRYDELKK